MACRYSAAKFNSAGRIWKTRVDSMLQLSIHLGWPPMLCRNRHSWDWIFRKELSLLEFRSFAWRWREKLFLWFLMLTFDLFRFLSYQVLIVLKKFTIFSILLYNNRINAFIVLVDSLLLRSSTNVVISFFSIFGCFVI